MSTFRIVENRDIDKVKWDLILSKYPRAFPYALSWYLDIVSPNWKALIVDDYDYVLALPWRKKWGFTYVYPPEFTQQIGVFGKEKASHSLIEEMISFASKEFSYLEFNLNKDNYLEFPKAGIRNKWRRNFVLNLSPSYHKLFKAFHKNTQRNIKKAKSKGLEIKSADDPELIISTFVNNKGKQLKEKNISYPLLNELYKAGDKSHSFDLFHIYKEDNFLGGALILNFQKRKIFLFSALNEKGREYKAMFFLLNHIIESNAENDLVLDFEGSDISDLATFYHRFGAKEKLYLHLEINRLPLLLKWLKN